MGCFQQLKDIRKMPEWRRTLYDACCWGGARKKNQKARHCIATATVCTLDPTGRLIVATMAPWSIHPRVRRNTPQTLLSP